MAEAKRKKEELAKNEGQDLDMVDGMDMIE